MKSNDKPNEQSRESLAVDSENSRTNGFYPLRDIVIDEGGGSYSVPPSWRGDDGPRLNSGFRAKEKKREWKWKPVGMVLGRLSIAFVIFMLLLIFVSASYGWTIG